MAMVTPNEVGNAGFELIYTFIRRLLKIMLSQNGTTSIFYWKLNATIYKLSLLLTTIRFMATSRCAVKSNFLKRWKRPSA